MSSQGDDGFALPKGHMRFDVDDKRNIAIMCDLIRAIVGGKQTVIFAWHRNEGWSVLQNMEFLGNLESSSLVNMCHVKSSFFAHLGAENEEFISFEIDLTNFAKVLKNISYQIRRMVWQVIDIDNERGTGQLVLNVVLEDGQLQVDRHISIKKRGISSLFYFRVFQEFSEDMTHYFELKAPQIRQLKDLKRNEVINFRFFEDFLTVFNKPEENDVSIRRTAMDKYDFVALSRNLQGRNRLLIPPNFLIPQLTLFSKHNDPLQFFFGNECIDDMVTVSLRTKPDGIVFISQFKSALEQDDDQNIRQNPFSLDRILNMHTNKYQKNENLNVKQYGMTPTSEHQQPMGKSYVSKHKTANNTADKAILIASQASQQHQQQQQGQKKFSEMDRLLSSQYSVGFQSQQLRAHPHATQSQQQAEIFLHGKADPITSADFFNDHMKEARESQQLLIQQEMIKSQSQQPQQQEQVPQEKIEGEDFEYEQQEKQQQQHYSQRQQRQVDRIESDEALEIEKMRKPLMQISMNSQQQYQQQNREKRSEPLQRINEESESNNIYNIQSQEKKENLKEQQNEASNQLKKQKSTISSQRSNQINSVVSTPASKQTQSQQKNKQNTQKDKLEVSEDPSKKRKLNEDKINELILNATCQQPFQNNTTGKRDRKQSQQLPNNSFTGFLGQVTHDDDFSVFQQNQIDQNNNRNKREDDPQKKSQTK